MAKKFSLFSGLFDVFASSNQKLLTDLFEVCG